MALFASTVLAGITRMPTTTSGFSATTASVSNSWATAGSAPLAIDASTPAVATGTSSTATTASFTPPDASLIMVNLLVNTQSGVGLTSVTVSNSGAALTWTLVGWVDSSHNSGRSGAAYVAWGRLATSRALTVTAASTSGSAIDGESLQVKVITGAHATTPIGATNSYADTSGTFAAAVTTTAANSWVWAAVNDWQTGAVPTAGANTTTVSGGVYTNGGAADSTASVLRATTTTATVGTSVTLANTAPTSVDWDIVAYEIRPAVSPYGSLALDVSSPAGVQSLGTSITTASFTPPSGSLLVANVDLDGGGGVNSAVVTNNGAALTWTTIGQVDATHNSGNNGGAYAAWAWLATSRALTVTFTLSMAGGADASAMKVDVFTGANSVSPIGNTSAAKDTSGTVAPSITTTVANSWVWATVTDFGVTGVMTPSARTVLDSYLDINSDGSHSSHNVLRSESITPVPGTAVTVSNTAPTSTYWNIVAYEIKPATGSAATARFVAAGAAATGTTTLSVAYPAGVQAADLLVMVVNHKGTGNPSVPATWTTLFTQGYPGTPTSLVGVYTLVHPSGGSTANVSVTGLTSSATGFILAFRETDATTPIAASPGGYDKVANASGTSGMTGKAVTPRLGDLVLATEGYGTNGTLTWTNITPDATKVESAQSATNASGTTNSSMAAYQPYIRSGGTNSLTGFAANHSVATDPVNGAGLIIIRRP